MDERNLLAYEFGPFRLEPSEYRLLRGGQPIPLTRKAYDLLLLLVENKGRLMEKTELINTLWAGICIEEGNLSVNISILRRSLEDGREGFKYIETVTKRGYRFVAEVKVVSGDTMEKFSGAHPQSVEDGDIGSSKESAIAIAVLPFANANNDPNLNYLAAGITGEIINNLAGFPGLKVLSWYVVSRYEQQEIEPQKIGRELNVSVILTGRVLQFGEHLVISVELISVESGWLLWGERYNRHPSDVLTLQEEIAADVSKKLSLRLAREEGIRRRRRYTENVNAYHLYLKGRYSWSKYTSAGYEQSIEYYQQAIKIDPAYALAYAGLAHSYYGLSYMYQPPGEAIPRAKAAATRALEIDGTLAEASLSLALIKYLYDWDWQGADEEMRRAIALNPDDALAHKTYGVYLSTMGRFEAARAELSHACELDPLSLSVQVSFGLYLYITRQFDQAIEQYKTALQLEPNFALAHMNLGIAYVKKGAYSEAIEELMIATELFDSPITLGRLGQAYAVAGDKSRALELAEKLLRLSKQRYVSPFYLAFIYAALGETNQAFEWLEKSYIDHSEGLAWLKVSLEFDSLRSDVRFGELLLRLGLSTPEH